MIERVRDEVESIANEKTSEVFALSLIIHKRRKIANYKEEFHKNKNDQQLLRENCDCEYCKNLKLYVILKKKHHRNKKILYDDDMLLSSKEVINLQEYLNDLKKSYLNYKKEKDLTKINLKLI